MMRKTKNIASEARNSSMPSSVRARPCHGAGLASSKFHGGGGDVVVHSSVQPFHGLSPATAPRRRLTTMFHTSTSTDTPSTAAPIVDSMFSAPHHGSAGY